MLKLTNISHRFGEHAVLDSINLTLHPGERMALMGPSGRGKTTLLRIALGLIEPTSGKAENTFSKTAAVFQEPRLLPWRTALENVNLVLEDSKKSEAQAKNALDKMQLSEAYGKYPRELSGGMQQRVALARALAMEADLLILDEPFKAMDEALRDRVIAQVGQTKAAILLVTHDEEEASALGCDIQKL